MELLPDIREKLAKKITLTMQLSEVSNKLIEDLTYIVRTNEGKCKVHIQIEDHKEKIRIDVPSKRLAINPSNEFLKKLEEVNVTYEINK